MSALRRTNRCSGGYGLVLSGLLALCASAVQGQVQVTASLSQSTITMDDLAELTVTVAAKGLDSPGAPSVPAVEGLPVISTSTQQSFSIINGSVQSTYGFTYILQPTRTGSFRLPPATVTVGGKTYSAAPLALRVTAGGSGPGSGALRRPLMAPSGSPPGWPSVPDPFGSAPSDPLTAQQAFAARHRVDRTRAYVGQQINYTFSFYQGAALQGDISYRQADTTGFVVEDLPHPALQNEILNGREYTVQRRQKALFATSPGKRTIGKAVVSLATDPFSDPQQVVADPLTVTIIPLPEQGRRADFAGGVGRFRVTLAADRQAVRAGETLSVTATVQGTGNVASLGPPVLRTPGAARCYPAGEKRQAKPGGGGGSATAIGGTAQFSYLVLLRQPGALKLGPVSYQYFDPGTGQYRVASSNALQIAVSPGTVSAAEPRGLLTNLRPLKTQPGHRVARPLPARLWFWPPLLLPLAAVLALGWQRWQALRVQADPRHARAGNALRLARQRLAEARRCLESQNAEACYAGLHATLADYIADRLDAPPAGLTADTACALLLEAGTAAALAERARALLERAASGRYAPGGSDPAQASTVVQEAEELLSALQEGVRLGRG